MRVILSTLVILVVLTGFIYHFKPTQSVVFFNKAQIQAHIIREMAEHNLDEAQVLKATEKFKSILQTLLQTFCERHAVVIMDSQFNLAGGKDVTPEIQILLAQYLRNNHAN